MATEKLIAKKKAIPKTPRKKHPKKALKPKIFSFVGDDGKTYTLTPQQKQFAEIFCDLSMNGRQAIIEAGYNVTNSKGYINYGLASSMASENLKKPNIAAYITTILDRYGLNDDNLDKQALGVATQWGDLGAKMKAIDTLYKKRGSYAPEKIEHQMDTEITEALDRLSKILREQK